MASSRARTLWSKCVARPLDRAGIGLAPSALPSRHARIVVPVWRGADFSTSIHRFVGHILAVAVFAAVVLAALDQAQRNVAAT